MFSGSQLAITSTTIPFIVAILLISAIITTATVISVNIHKKRVAKTKPNKTAKKNKSKAAKKVKEKTNTQTKNQTEIQTETKEQVTEKQTDIKEIPLTVVDKSDLIGEKLVKKEDLALDSKYDLAYSIKIKRNSQNDVILSWKTNDVKSMLESLNKDLRAGRFYVLNDDAKSIEIKAKYQDENKLYHNYSKKFEPKENVVLNTHQFVKEIQGLIDKMSLSQQKTEKNETVNSEWTL